MLEAKLNEDYKTALKGKDSVKVSVIRMLKSDMGITAVRSGKQSLTDDEILKIISKHIHQHNDSITQFKNGNRQDLAAQEEKELAVLKTYVPEQLSDDALAALIRQVIAEMGPVTKKDMGKVMKAVMEKAEGKADGKRTSACVQSLLGS
ncbi:MAG: GatB/YqeY domain-containing protein [Candidatus Omnitrophica bacterium]|nr:GatB/YqeY domain-containing protein [Candidatus Omnitrophota bacterium]